MGCSLQWKIHQLSWPPRRLRLKLNQETSGWSGGGVPSVASAEGKGAITTARMERRREQQRTCYLSWTTWWTRRGFKDTWNITFWGTRKPPEMVASREDNSTKYTRITTSLPDASPAELSLYWNVCLASASIPGSDGVYLAFISDKGGLWSKEKIGHLQKCRLLLFSSPCWHSSALSRLAIDRLQLFSVFFYSHLVNYSGKVSLSRTNLFLPHW